MNSLSINLQNCFGIGKLAQEFDFSLSNTFLIYAPNGTMKTSFAKTFDTVSKNDPKNQPRDRVYKDRVPKCEILCDGNPINPDNILVVNAEDSSFNASHKISTFLASKDLKKSYDEIYLELNNRKTEFIKKLKTISQSTDCESEFMNTFGEKPNASFFEILSEMIESLKTSPEKYQFRYNDIFDKKGNVRKFLEKNQTVLTQYINSYQNLLSKSKFFKDSAKNSFGTYQANEIIKSIEDNAFFDAGHKFILEDGTEIASSEMLKQVVQQEIQAILEDKNLKDAFDKVDKAIGANTELRAFQKVIEKDNLILISLQDYDGFKKIVWINYLSEIASEAQELVNHYAAQKKEIEAILKDAKKEFNLWTKIIKTFNSRFFIPFKVILSNQEDVILKQETANLEFDYSDKNDEPVRQRIDSLLEVLSKGEQRAYFILQFLFEIESRKLRAEKTLLILDDIADSFDYKNKFAIIEYIRDLNSLDFFRIIILTHNFDFYRTIASRLGLPRKVVYMATKSIDKVITLHDGQYRKDVFAHFIGRCAEQKVFISLIAFVRNIIEYSDGQDTEEYTILTDCLHRKVTSDVLTANDIFTVFKNRLPKLNGKTIAFGNINLMQLISNTADDICNEANINEILLENKIVLAVAIRLNAEKYLISKLPEVDLNTITINQTHDLFRKYQVKYNASENLDILDKVNLMTPENIHINAFMYEPLIDMSVNHLVDLHNKIKEISAS
jgi:hypothetical protein